MFLMGVTNFILLKFTNDNLKTPKNCISLKNLNESSYFLTLENYRVKNTSFKKLKRH